MGSAGTGIAFAAACALRRVWNNDVHLVAMDIHARHLVTTCILSDHFVQVPDFASPAFSQALIELVEANGIDTYLPLYPLEIELAAGMVADGRLPESLSVMAPSLKGSVLCADKLALTEYLRAHGVGVPMTAPAEAPFAADRYFLKRRLGSGSRGAREVVASQLATAIAGEPEQWVVQEICVRPELTIDTFHDGETDFLRTICRERLQVKSGVSTKCRLFFDAELDALARRLAQSLHLQGSFCFQVMRTVDGWVVTDVNPRPGAATAMCLPTGNDFFAASFAFSWKQDFARFFTPLAGESFVTRQYSEFLMEPPS